MVFFNAEPFLFVQSEGQLVQRVKKVLGSCVSFHTFADENIQQYEKNHPITSPFHLANGMRKEQ